RAWIGCRTPAAFRASRFHRRTPASHQSVAGAPARSNGGSTSKGAGDDGRTDWRPHSFSRRGRSTAVGRNPPSGGIDVCANIEEETSCSRSPCLVVRQPTCRQLASLNRRLSLLSNLDGSSCVCDSTHTH